MIKIEENSYDERLNKEARRVIASLPKMEGVQDGKSIRYNIRINFKIDLNKLLIFKNESEFKLNNTEKIILELWSEKIKESVITQIDAKTKLQEFSLKKFKKLPIYKIVSDTGPRHKPIFRIAVKLNNTKFYNGEGKSKKEAEQNAALLCLNDNLR